MSIDIQKNIIEIDFNQLQDDSIANDISTLSELEFDVEAKRPGPKSAAQTPAKPSEKRKGSSKNKPDSASSKDEANITFSAKVIEALKNKVKEHNSKYSKKVNLSQLKKVYRRGAGAYSSSHRPGKTRSQWAMARVNMFLRMMAGGKVKDAYRKADKDIVSTSNYVDVSDFLNPLDEDFSKAEEDIQSYDLNYDFEDAEDLYLEDEETSNRFWYEL